LIKRLSINRNFPRTKYENAAEVSEAPQNDGTVPCPFEHLIRYWWDGIAILLKMSFGQKKTGPSTTKTTLVIVIFTHDNLWV